MWTIYYKGVPIHGSTNKDECWIWWDKRIDVPTLIGAKRMITRLQKRLIEQQPWRKNEK